MYRISYKICFFVFLLICYIIPYDSFVTKVTRFIQLSKCKEDTGKERMTVYNSASETNEMRDFVYDKEENYLLEKLDDNLKYFREYAKRGLQRFKDRNLNGSLADFNRAKQMNGTQPLIQRGVLLYLLGDFIEAEKQFDEDILKLEDLQNEKASDLRLWRSACLNKLNNPKEAKRAIDIYLTQFDLAESRLWMNTTLEFYSGKREVMDIMELMDSTEESDFMGNRFFGNFFLALYYDSIGEYDLCQGFLEFPCSSSRYPPEDMWYHVPRVLYDLRFNKLTDVDDN